MKKAVLFLLIITSSLSCNTLSDDFFNFILGSDNTSLNLDCSNSSFLDFGGDFRYIEVYSFEDFDLENVIQNFKSSSYKVKQNSEFLRTYQIPVWQSTPISNDTIFNFIHKELEEEENPCFSESELKSILLTEGNYFLNLQDRLGRSRMFFLDSKKGQLYYLSQYLL